LKGENHKILITFSLDNKVLEFRCSNPYSKKLIEKNDWIESGIGITNTRKRLTLLYPKRHELVIDEKDSVFSIYLNIQL
jgi:sensor histidine kinase YesM